MKEILAIAWRNIGRNKRRSILSAAAIAFAVAILTFSMSLQQGAYANVIYNTVHNSTGHVQIQHRDYWPDRNLWKRVAHADDIIAEVKQVPHVIGAAPRVNATALVSAGTHSFGAIIKGIAPDHERAVSTLADVIVDGSFLSAGDDDGALVGSMLAKNLGVTVGGELVFLGQGADGSLAAGRLTVRGILRTGISEIDRTMVVTALPTVQEAFSMTGGVSEIAVLMDDDRRRHDVAEQIRERLQRQGHGDAVVVDWSTLMPGVEQSIKVDWTAGLILYALLATVVGFGIANTFIMAFMERIHELGVLLALGMRPALLSAMLYIESVLLSVSGIVLGLIAGALIVQYVHGIGIHFGDGSEELMARYGMSPTIYPELSWLVVRWAVGIVLTVALMVAIYPAARAARLEPAKALHNA